MTAHPCYRCGKLILFAKDRDTGATVMLTNQAAIWRAIPSKGGPVVIREPKMLSTHYCTQQDQPPAAVPEAETHFSEPRDPA